jgi:hypothetical protein
MAITNAQQYQQLVNKPADGKRPGYRGIGGYQEGKSAPSSKSSSSSKSSESLGGGGGRDYSPPSKPTPSKPTTKTSTPPGGGKDASTQSFDKSLNPNRPGGPIGRDDSGATPPQEYIGGTTFDVSPQTKEEQEKKNFAISLENDRRRVEARKQKLKEIAFLDNLGMLGYTRRTKDANLEELGMIDPQTMRIAGYEMPNILSGITSAITVDPSTDYFDIDSIREIGGVLSKSPTGITKTQANTLGDLRQDIQMEDRINNPDDRVTQSEFEEYMNRNKVILPEGGGGDQPILTPYQEDVVEDEVDPNSLAGMLANRGLAYRFMADGGRAGFMGGGMPYEGGIMDLESARQMYGLGKLVKKATGAIKKIVKSPVGKAALLYFGGNALMNTSGGLGIKDFLTRSFLGKEVSGGALAGRGRTGGIFQFIKDNPLLTIAGGSTLAGLLSSQDEEEEPYDRGPGLDIDAIRRDPYGTKGPAFGFYAEGGNVKEPVAKNTMRLLDMNGMEKDYRADGGFVPIGRMERADDVPARLSKNEFVFTADAVRNAGDGDIDKGAEVMYNMMKNLEAGGDISEESQGLNGARDMFQTSKRLEEVL